MLSSLFQTLFRRGRPTKERRRLPSAGACPGVGSTICRRHMMMKVTQPLQQDLWDWLVLMGWREAKVRPDRRRYKRLPDTAIERLVSADRADREEVYQDMTGLA